jgi:hypothetical protein
MHAQILSAIRGNAFGVLKTDHTTFGLSTDSGELLGVRRAFDNTDQAKAAIDRYGRPSLIFTRNDESVFLWLLNEHICSNDPRLVSSGSSAAKRLRTSRCPV